MAAIETLGQSKGKSKKTGLVFKPAPELAHVSAEYPADFAYTYEIATYKGVRIKRCFVNGRISAMGEYYIEAPVFSQHCDTQKEAMRLVDRFCK